MDIESGINEIFDRIKAKDIGPLAVFQGMRGMVKELVKERDELRAYKEAAEKQEARAYIHVEAMGDDDHYREIQKTEPNCQPIEHLSWSDDYAESFSKEAIDFTLSLGGTYRVVPLYAKPVPADKPGHWAVMSPGRADQYRAESVAVRKELGFSEDSDEVAPIDLLNAIRQIRADRSRITEQDARETALSVLLSSGFVNGRDYIDPWLNREGRALLNKLNADREQVPAVAVPTYPMQPVIKDANGRDRFEANPIVDMLVQRVGLNEIAVWWQVNNIPAKYMEQLAQLIGYSVSGYGELSYVSDESYALAEKLAAAPHHSQQSARPTDDELWDQTITERDTYHDWADKLANAISEYFGSDIGEHTSANNPWAEALEVIECADKPAGPDAHDKNAQRYLWIKENIQEELTQGSLKDSEYAEHKTRYKLPLLISWADFCGHISLDDAIDNQISRGDRWPSHESEQ